MITTSSIEYTEKELINLALLFAEQYMLEVSRISRNLWHLEEAEQYEQRAKQFRNLADKRKRDPKTAT